MAPSPRAVRFDLNSDNRQFVYPPFDEINTGDGQEGMAPVNLSPEGDLVDKQRLLLKFLMTFKVEQVNKERSCSLFQQSYLIIRYFVTMNYEFCFTHKKPDVSKISE